MVDFKLTNILCQLLGCGATTGSSVRNDLVVTVFPHLLAAVCKSYQGSSVRSKCKFYEVNPTSSSSPSPSVRSARSLQKGHLVQKCFVFICVCSCDVCAAMPCHFDGVGLGVYAFVLLYKVAPAK